MDTLCFGVTAFRAALLMCNHSLVTGIRLTYGEFYRCNHCNHFFGTYPPCELRKKFVSAWRTISCSSRRGDVSFFGYSGYGGFLDLKNRIDKPNSPGAAVPKSGYSAALAS